MRKRTARILWLVVGAVALGLLAIGATSYVMRLDQEAANVGSVPAGVACDQASRRKTAARSSRDYCTASM